MTSNVGATQVKTTASLGFIANKEAEYDKMCDRYNDALKEKFRPEFLNRIDEIVTFGRLEKDAIFGIVKNQLERVEKRLEDRKLHLVVSEEAMEFLSEVGYDPLFGARPVKRAIQNYLENPLAKEIISGNFREDSTINVGVNNNNTALTFISAENVV
jgi:ATP-dependent Clp protease ATP-binding subunit ClpB